MGESTLLSRGKGLTNNALKIIAMLTMLIDHVGLILFPQTVIFRIIGRISFPIFAFMIAEGCAHTRNRKKYLLQIAIVAIICQVVFTVFTKSYLQNILLTFSLAVITIFAIDYFISKKTVLSGLLMALTVLAVAFICYLLPEVIVFEDFAVDGTYLSVLLPILVYYAPKKWLKLLATALILCLLPIKLEFPIQWYALLSLPLLALYNGSRGKLKIKYLFYLFYPLHLAVLYGLKMLIIYLKYYR